MLRIRGLLLLFLTCCYYGRARALLVPEQVTSLLHVFLTSVPQIQRGTDSRVGIGFRFGPLADAQLVWELGPQTLTRPLSDPVRDQEETAKRQTVGIVDPFSFRNKYYIPGLLDNTLTSQDDNSISRRAYSMRGRSLELEKSAGSGSGSGSDDWLMRWRAGISSRSSRSSQAVEHVPGSGAGRGLRIFLAPSTTSSPLTVATLTDPPSVHVSAKEHLRNTVSALQTTPKSTRRRPKLVRESKVEMHDSSPWSYLRTVMASMTATTPAPSRTTSPNPNPTFARPGSGIMRILRQLWEAGTKATSASTFNQYY